MYKVKHAFLLTCILSTMILMNTILLWRLPIVLTFNMLILSIALLMLHEDDSEYWLFLLSGAFGVIAESISVSFGIWQYAIANIWGVPFWLFFLWGTAALFIKRLSHKIKQVSLKGKIWSD